MNKLNLGRVKGEKGDTGPQGPKGDTGPPGPQVNILQTTGSSTDSPMSQKAVTDELDAINLLIGDTSAALDAINGEVV